MTLRIRVLTLITSRFCINVGSIYCSDVPACTDLSTGSRLDTVAANCLRSAMENEFPMVVTTLPTFPSTHQANTDVDISEFCTVGPVEASATSSSSSLAPALHASVSCHVIDLLGRGFADSFCLKDISGDVPSATPSLRTPASNSRCT